VQSLNELRDRVLPGLPVEVIFRISVFLYCPVIQNISI